MEDIQKIQIEAKKAEIKAILLQFHEAQMDGKGFDFFFVLSDRLDELNKDK